MNGSVGHHERRHHRIGQLLGVFNQDDLIQVGGHRDFSGTNDLYDIINFSPNVFFEMKIQVYVDNFTSCFKIFLGLFLVFFSESPLSPSVSLTSWTIISDVWMTHHAWIHAHLRQPQRPGHDEDVGKVHAEVSAVNLEAVPEVPVVVSILTKKKCNQQQQQQK